MVIQEGWDSEFERMEQDPFLDPLQVGADIHKMKAINALKTFLNVILMQRYKNDGSLPDKPYERHQFEALCEDLPLFLPSFYGEEYFDTHKEEIKRSYNLSHTKSVVLMLTGRQYGKTEGSIRELVGLLLSCPKWKPGLLKWVVVSYKGELVRDMLKRAHDFILRLDFQDNYHYVYSRMKLKLVNLLDNTDVREAHALEGNIDGHGGEKFFIDEFFKWKENIAVVQFPPQLQIKGTMAKITTTLKGRVPWSTNFITTNNKLLHLINYSEICSNCISLPMEEAIKCNHVRPIQTHFVDMEKREAIISLMPREYAISEMYNLTPNVLGQLWGKEYLKERIKDRRGKDVFNKVVAFVDPSMTGMGQSASAITIIGENLLEEIFVLYLDSKITPSETTIVDFIVGSLFTFVSKFKSFKTKDWCIKLMVEHNTFTHARELDYKISKISKLMDRVDLIRAIEKDKMPDEKTKVREFKRIGVRKKAYDEERYAQILDDKLKLGKIYIHEECFTQNTIGIERMIDTLIEQSSNVRYIPNKFGGTGRIVSKLDINNKQVLNDLYISFVSAIYHTALMKGNSEESLYRQWVERAPVSQEKIFFE